ncbi:hypothetical protein HNP84_003073 [Thermocatellispora tengchongensis]|uniref:Secreted protein n=1 Tax=Thermocatellispora tengchongensis TaxID=1073253 RepID=A0A840P808_9ACTN|nr:hypothetical protein [Thermocatellispora tengchongensis]MBB5133347.1 hypothetical protein [Thermocatellispora tengchongensis]
MRSRLPAVVLLLLSAFVLSGAPAHLAQPATAAAVAWWSAPAPPHSEADGAARVLPACGAPVFPMWPAVLPPAWEPGQTTRPVTAATGRPPASPQRGRCGDPARAPPSTTR